MKRREQDWQNYEQCREKKEIPPKERRGQENQGKKEKGRNQCLKPIRTSLQKQYSTGQKGDHYKAQKQEVERHLWETHSDDRQWEDLGECEMIVAEPEILKKARAVSAPGHNGLPCKVYKKCPKILKHLQRRLKVHNPIHHQKSNKVLGEII